MNKVRNLWEKRSSRYKDDIKGVLPKSFPNWLNKILDAWMFSKVRSTVKSSDLVLDLGCGYGRVAEEILEEISRTRVRGIDISQNYVEIFNRNLNPRGEADRGDIKKLFFKKNTFDSVVMITTLMYLTKKHEQKNAMREIFRVLKPGGRFVFIERNPDGHKLMTLWGLVTLLRGSKNKEIDSVSFTRNQMSWLIEWSGGEVKNISGFPFGKLLDQSLYISYQGVKK